MSPEDAIPLLAVHQVMAEVAKFMFDGANAGNSWCEIVRQDRSMVFEPQQIRAS